MSGSFTIGFTDVNNKGNTKEMAKEMYTMVKGELHA